MTGFATFMAARLTEDHERFAANPHDDTLAASADLNEGYIVGLHERLRVECEAKRARLTRHERVGEDDPSCEWCSAYEPTGLWSHEEPWPCPDLRADAAVYADHPDFDPAWRL